jgi:hypothetical protein
MQEKLKNYSLVICLFVFLFVVIGKGLHLTPTASFTWRFVRHPDCCLCF